MEEEKIANWSVDVIADLAQLYQIREEWNRLLRESQYDTINLTHEWLSTVWKHYTSFDKTAELCVLCIKKPSGELIAILPLMTVKIPFKIFFKIKQLCFLGQDFNDYSGFIIKRNCEEIVLNFFLRSILSKAKFIDWDVLLLKNLSSRNLNLDYLRKLFVNESYDLAVKESTKYFYIKTDEGLFKDYYQTMSKNFRNDLRKCQNRMERYSNENAKKISFIFGDDRILERKFVFMLTAWQIERMKSVHKLSSFTNEPVRDFCYDFITSSYEHVLTVTLNMNGDPVAFCICLIYQRSLFFWIHGSDPGFYFLSPNKIILGKIIEYCFSRGYKFCDFSRGGHEYKEKWTKDYHLGYLLRTYNFRKPIVKLLSRIQIWR